MAFLPKNDLIIRIVHPGFGSNDIPARSGQGAGDGRADGREHEPNFRPGTLNQKTGSLPSTIFTWLWAKYSFVSAFMIFGS